MESVFTSLQSVFPIVVLLIPGIIWIRCESKFKRRNRRDSHDLVINYVIYSAINYAIWWMLWLPGLVRELSTAVSSELSTISVLKWLVIMAVSPAVGGLVTGVIKAADIPSRVLCKLNLRPQDHDLTGWDQAFKSRESCIARIELSDDEVVFGLYSSESRASSDHLIGDIYLERVMEENDEGKIVQSESNRGVWLKGDHVKSIAFYDIDELGASFKQQKQANKELPYEWAEEGIQIRTPVNRIIENRQAERL